MTEIRALLDNSETLRFGAATRSFDEVRAAYEEISANYAQDERYGIVGAGLTVNDNKTDFVVKVDVNGDSYEETAALLSDKYGDLVEVTNGDAATANENTADGSADGDTAEKPARTPRETLTYMILYIGLVLVMSILLSARRQKRAKERK